MPDRIVVVSSEIGRQLRRFVPDKLIRVSSTGVDLEEFVNWNESRKNQLVTIGAFKWKKGYVYLLEAARLVFRGIRTTALSLWGMEKSARRLSIPSSALV